MNTPLLLHKLRNKGLSPNFLSFLTDYLSTRQAIVLVHGQSSDPIDLSNMVFQGTVLGPCLWNVFFHDVDSPLHDTDFKDTEYADDLSHKGNYFTTLASNTTSQKRYKHPHVTTTYLTPSSRTFPHKLQPQYYPKSLTTTLPSQRSTFPHRQKHL